MSGPVEFKIERREALGRADLFVKCELHHSGWCQHSLWTNPANGLMWNWNGNMEQPSVSPSIDCKGGCGRHFNIVNGKIV